MTLKTYKPLLFILLLAAAVFFLSTQTGCGVYRFKDVSIPDSIKVVKVNFIENRATYVNPTLSPQLTDKLRQKIVSQTKLKQTNGDDADWEINATITGYTFGMAGMTNQQTSMTQLTITVKVVIDDKRAQKENKYDVSRNFTFDSKLSVQQAETQLADQIIRDLTDDIFNKMFSNW